MLLGRTNELQYLNTVYENAGSRIVVVYGQKNVGKTTLLNEFVSGKDAFFYTAVPASTRQQQFMLGKKLSVQYGKVSEYPDYDEILSTIQTASSIKSKKIYIFDEWEHMIKTDNSFMDALIRLNRHAYSENDSLVILCSSSIGFIENGLVSKIGKSALDISGFLKIKELKFVDIIRYFPKYSISDCVKIYSILGGFPGLWQYFEPQLSVEENICQNILKKGCFLFDEGGRIVKDELREPAVYDTILSALAQGMEKLNLLYSHTGFSRAKISVYLKNLMELEITEKVFSMDTPGRSSQKKGVYRISNAYVHFWFKYIYSNYTDALHMSPEEFYDKNIRHDLNSYCDAYFSKICREYMILSAAKGGLAINPEKCGSFEGKEGCIDYIGQDSEGTTITAFCSYSAPVLTYEKYEQYLYILEQAKLKPVQIYLFSGGSFDEKLTREAGKTENLILLEMDDL